MNNPHQETNSFRRNILRNFLPSVIKPGRFIAGEWRNISAHFESEAPLAAICSPQGYERAVNDPFTVAVSETLATGADDKSRWQIGFTYALPDDIYAGLRDLGAAPFVSPQLAPLNSAGALVVPLSGPAELAGLHRLLAQANIAFSVSEREKQPAAPLLLAVVPEREALSDTPAGKLLADVFDRVDGLAEFSSLCEKVESLFSTQADTGTPGPYIPHCPPAPLIEANSQRARFSFVKHGASKNISAQQISSALARATAQTGLTELELANCQHCPDGLSLSEILGAINIALPQHVNSVTLLHVSPQQAGAELGARLKRYRRARVEIALSSLSPTCSERAGFVFSSDDLVNRIAATQRAGAAQVSLDVAFGYAGYKTQEISETVETLTALSRSIDRKLGIRVRFKRRDPSPNSYDQTIPLLTCTETEELFGALRSQARARGVSLSLANQFNPALSALMMRGAWNTANEFAAFLKEVDETNGPERVALLDRHAGLLCKPLSEIISTTTPSAQVTTLAPDKSPEAAHPATGANGNSNVSSGFGRGKKRAGSRTVAAPTKSRVRIIWGKKDLARFYSHLDNMRALESALLRSGLPLSYTQGQKPRLKISYGPPLPLGFTSSAEIMDAHFETPPPPNLKETLNSLLPDGFEIHSAQIIYTKELSALESVRAAEYEITLDRCELETLERALKNALGSSKVTLARKTKSGEKTIDIRPGIYSASLTESPEGKSPALNVTLALTDTYYVRPDEFISAICQLSVDWRKNALIHRRALLHETPSYQSNDHSTGVLR